MRLLKDQRQPHMQSRVLHARDMRCTDLAFIPGYVLSLRNISKIRNAGQSTDDAAAAALQQLDEAWFRAYAPDPMAGPGPGRLGGAAWAAAAAQAPEVSGPLASPGPGGQRPAPGAAAQPAAQAPASTVTPAAAAPAAGCASKPVQPGRMKRGSAAALLREGFS